MIFVARQIQEKCQEQNKDLYIAFIDLIKAFESINRGALWKVPSRLSCPANFITILRLLHDKMTATVLINGIEIEPFTIRIEMKQGCDIAPTLFTIYLCAITFLVSHRLPCGVKTDYRLDGRLFNLCILKAKTKVTKTAVIDLQYADDCAIFSHTAEELQTSLDILTEAYHSIGLSINIRKTKIICQSAPGNIEGPPDIKIYGITLEVFDSSRT